MRAALLVLCLSAMISISSAAVPNYEMFIVAPKDVAKQTVITKGATNEIDATLIPRQAREFLAFTRRNVGKQAIIGWLTMNKTTNSDLIQLTSIFVKAPVHGGTVHVSVENPKWISHDLF